MRNVLILMIVAACSEPEVQISVGEPRLEDPPTSIYFGDVLVDHAVTATWTLENSGIGDLTVASMTYIGDAAIHLIEPITMVEAGSTADIKLGFTPTGEMEHSGVLSMETDDPDYPVLVIPVSGVGVVANLDISPENLWFGEIAVGDSYTQTTTLSSVGSGAVTVNSFEFINPDDTVDFVLNLPDEMAPPFTIEPGHALSLSVTYAPVEASKSDATEFIVVSNDTEFPYMPIMFYTGEAKGGDEPPVVEIIEPEWGTRWGQDQSVPILAHAIDPDNAPDTLTVTVYLDGMPVGGGAPDSSGSVQWWSSGNDQMIYSLASSAIGDHDLMVIATDPDGNTGMDEVSFAVDPADVQVYTISGAESVFEYISVDDDLRVEVNGSTVYLDDNGSTDAPAAPFEFEADVGDVIRIIATDANPCRKSISDVYLHYGTNNTQKLVDATRTTACEGEEADPDYDATYTGPWPNDFLDTEVTIKIPE